MEIWEREGNRADLAAPGCRGKWAVREGAELGPARETGPIRV